MKIFIIGVVLGFMVSCSAFNPRFQRIEEKDEKDMESVNLIILE